MTFPPEKKLPTATQTQQHTKLFASGHCATRHNFSHFRSCFRHLPPRKSNCAHRAQIFSSFGLFLSPRFPRIYKNFKDDGALTSEKRQKKNCSTQTAMWWARPYRAPLQQRFNPSLVYFGGFSAKSGLFLPKVAPQLACPLLTCIDLQHFASDFKWFPANGGQFPFLRIFTIFWRFFGNFQRFSRLTTFLRDFHRKLSTLIGFSLKFDLKLRRLKKFVYYRWTYCFIDWLSLTVCRGREKN